MTKLHTQKLQTKFNYYLKKLSENITKPESRFVHETVFRNTKRTIGYDEPDSNSYSG